MIFFSIKMQYSQCLEFELLETIIAKVFVLYVILCLHNAKKEALGCTVQKMLGTFLSAKKRTVS